MTTKYLKDHQHRTRVINKTLTSNLLNDSRHRQNMIQDANSAVLYPKLGSIFGTFRKNFSERDACFNQAKKFDNKESILTFLQDDGYEYPLDVTDKATLLACFTSDSDMSHPDFDEMIRVRSIPTNRFPFERDLLLRTNMSLLIRNKRLFGLLSKFMYPKYDDSGRMSKRHCQTVYFPKVLLMRKGLVENNDPSKEMYPLMDDIQWNNDEKKYEFPDSFSKYVSVVCVPGYQTIYRRDGKLKRSVCKRIMLSKLKSIADLAVKEGFDRLVITDMNIPQHLNESRQVFQEVLDEFEQRYRQYFQEIVVLNHYYYEPFESRINPPSNDPPKEYPDEVLLEDDEEAGEEEEHED